MKVKTLSVGSLQTNCYLLTDEITSQTIIIDPGDEADFITTTILENKLIPTAILLTHGHYDHCLGVLELQLNFPAHNASNIADAGRNIPIYLHKNDYFLYKNAHLSAKHFSNIKIPMLPTIKNFLEDKQTISFGENSLQVIHTPGHTPGSCCFLTNKHLFTGDTLFATGPGATDRSYSSKLDLKNSLIYLRSTINDLTTSGQVYLYPGHEEWGVIFPPSPF